MQDKNARPIPIHPSSLIERNVNRSDEKQSTMQSAVHISAQVLPGKKIEISSAELPVGDSVDVFIIVPHTSSHSNSSTINLQERVRSLNNNQSQGQHLLSKPLGSKIQSDITVAIEALEAIGDYLAPEPGSICEEMLNDALEGRIRVEATDMQDKMLVKHHAKKYVEQAIATLQRLNS
ncbi:MAG TPA: hypothetical protein V6C91_13660 [Coleofasciculaceae cyanobacterium]